MKTKSSPRAGKKYHPEIATLEERSLLSTSSYGGFPAITGLTTIQPEITITRLSGTTPLAVQVSASGTTMNGQGDPFTDLEYTWDFGDLTGTEVFTNTVTSQSVNADTMQTGPEAMYVYRQPGAYTITLHVRGWNGSQFVSAQTTMLEMDAQQSIEVQNATGGTFRLSYDNGAHWTTPIAYNASGADVVAAIAALPNIGPGNVTDLQTNTQTKHGMFEFTGTLAGTAMPTPLIDASSLQGTGVRCYPISLQQGGTSPVVTASNFTGTTYYIDPAGGSDNYDGLAPSFDGTHGPKQTWNALTTIYSGGSNRQILLKRGTTLTASGSLGLNGAVICSSGLMAPGPTRSSATLPPPLPSRPVTGSAATTSFCPIST